MVVVTCQVVDEVEIALAEIGFVGLRDVAELKAAVTGRRRGE